MSECTDVSADNMGVHGSTCLYISTKGTGVHAVTPTDESKVKMFVRVRTDTYGKYRREKTIQDIGTYGVGKVRKGISYADALQQGY